MSAARAVRANVDVAVVGAGPAGIAAAVRAAECGARVVLLDEGPEPGGQIWRPRLPERQSTIVDASKWLARLERSGASIERGASVVEVRAASGAESGFFLAVESGGSPSTIRAQRVVIATGARERFLPFPGWTLPGVVGIGGAQALLKSGASMRGKRVVIAGSGPLILPVAASLARAGARIELVAEQAPMTRVARFAIGLWRSPRTLAQAASYRAAFLRTRYETGAWVTQATGDDRVREVMVATSRGTRRVACDMLCTGYGLVPTTELARVAGCDVRGGVVIVDARQETGVRGLFCAGEPTGVGGVELSLVEGEIAGFAAAGREAIHLRLLKRRDRSRAYAAALDSAFALRQEVKHLAQADTIVCRCEDVRFGALQRQWSARQAKLYTRLGMGPCQGRVCGAALETLFGWSADVARPPVQPALVGTLIASAASDSDSLDHDLQGV